ncbi:hypothetical protein B0H16DRAFT_1824953 [Mycena metata]|uniref:Uncharacterized protein n=1 Tax=Mycena metata TaxID=1033252 RepID=A0AAD7J627_9AGAR|nr:hypothetical protein B0H16DRAFT_1824953 [Mycena metata]
MVHVLLVPLNFRGPKSIRSPPSTSISSVNSPRLSSHDLLRSTFTMFTKFIPIAVLLGAPLLSAAAPAPFFGFGATVTVFQCPPSASASLASSSVAASASPSAAPATGGGGGGVSVSDPAANLLSSLTSVNSLLNGLTSTLLPNILNSVTGLLNTLTGVTSQLNSLQSQIGTLTTQLGSVTSGLNGLTGILGSLGTGGVFGTAGASGTVGTSGINANDISTILQSFLTNLGSLTSQINNVASSAQGSGANLSALRQAYNDLTNACILQMPSLVTQPITSAERQLASSTWSTLQPKMQSCSKNIN